MQSKVQVSYAYLAPSPASWYTVWILTGPFLVDTVSLAVQDTQQLERFLPVWGHAVQAKNPETVSHITERLTALLRTSPAPQPALPHRSCLPQGPVVAVGQDGAMSLWCLL